MLLRGASITDVGKKEINQDRILIKNATYNQKRLIVCAVADGMGGLSCGEVASQIAIDKVEEWFSNELPSLMESKDMDDKLLASWEMLLYYINEGIINYGIKNGVNLGTTLIIFLLYDFQFYAVNIGDSRLYTINEKQGVELITRDDTWLQMQLDEMPSEIKNNKKAKDEYIYRLNQDARKNMLTQCLGYIKNIDPSFYTNNVSEEEYFLLCSDGFRNELTNNQILEMMYLEKKGLNLKEILETKLEYIKSTEENDNISAILIKAYKDVKK